jgi:biopolymer transport protein ExbD
MKKFDSINVIPFVDIMLVLLAIVLTSATFVTNSQLDIALPTAAGAATTPPVEPIDIAVDRNGQWYLRGRSVNDDELLASIAVLPLDSAIRLKVDESAQFQRFVRLVDALTVRGIAQVSVETQAAQ